MPRSDYTVRSACDAPSPGHVSCMALQLVARTAAAAAHTHPLGITRADVKAAKAPSPAAGDFGLRPADLHSAYELPTASEATQTVAVVDVYHDLTAESDLKAYSEEFGLPECTTANGCFKQVNEEGQTGNPPFPTTANELKEMEKGGFEEQELAEEAVGWGLEISLDLDAVHATCQNCKIILVEASSSSLSDLEAAEQQAGVLGATEISNSFGGPEVGETREAELASPFNNPGTVVTASAGDDGYLNWDAENSAEHGYASFPASSPHVISVGGTRLQLQPGGAWASEVVWNGNGAGGGGCSKTFFAPNWQQSVADWSAVGCSSKRAVSDVSADADPYTGIAVHYSSPECELQYEEAKVKHVVHWCTIGGTSLASPLIASVYALAGGAHEISYPARTLYENQRNEPSGFHDVTSGSNGACGVAFNEETGVSGCSPSQEAASCESHLICLAAGGYDGPTGVGTPHGIAGFIPGEEAESGEEEVPQEEGPLGGLPKSKGSPGGTTTTPGTGVTPPPVNTGPPPVAGAAASARVSFLKLTSRAVVALAKAHPRMSQISFAFQLDSAASVRVEFFKRVRVHRKLRWKLIKRLPATAAVAGANSRHLGGSTALRGGLYKLTVTPTPGTGRTVEFRIGF